MRVRREERVEMVGGGKRGKKGDKKKSGRRGVEESPPHVIVIGCWPEIVIGTVQISKLILSTLWIIATYLSKLIHYLRRSTRNPQLDLQPALPCLRTHPRNPLLHSRLRYQHQERP